VTPRWRFGPISVPIASDEMAHYRATEHSLDTSMTTRGLRSPFVRVKFMPESLDSDVVSRLGQKLVADAVDGSKMNRLRRILFKFLTQSQDVVVDGAGAGIVFVTPNLVQ